MKRFYLLFVLIGVFVLQTIRTQAQFSESNLAVIVAASNTANNTTASVVEINKTTESQTAIQTIAIPGTGTNAIRVSGSATSTLYASHSADFKYFVFTGHNSETTGSNANTLNPRAVVTIDNAGNISLATTYTGTSGQQTRCATSLNNINWFIGDQGGFFTNGAIAASPTANVRAVRPFGGIVYAQSTTTGAIGTISAVTGGTYTMLNFAVTPSTTGLQDFYLVSSSGNDTYDILYLIYATSATVGNIAKYSLVEGSWVANGTSATTFGGFGMAAEKSGAGADLFISTGAGATAANSVRKLSDGAGYNTTINITSNIVLYTTAAGTTIKGVGFAPKAASATPAITVNPTSLSDFEYVQGAGPSAEKSFTVSGANLTASISITPSTNYEISTGTGGAFTATNPITLNQSGGTVNSTTIYVRLKSGLTNGIYNSENITLSSSGADNETVSCSGSVTAVAPPSINANPGSLSGFTYVEGSGPSDEQSFSVNGSNLTGNLVVTPSTNYEISLTTGSNFAQTAIQLTPASGTVAATTIYVRLIAGLSAGSYNGEMIVCSSAGATDAEVELDGSVTAEPGAGYIVDFEGAGETKPAYASGTVSLTGLNWNMTEVLIGVDANDWKNGLRSARLRGYGTSVMTMLEGKANGLGTLSFKYRRYGTATQVDWKVEYATSANGPWTQVGTDFTAPATDVVQNFSEVVNVSGTIFIRIKRATETGAVNRQLNIDDIVMTDFAGGGNIPPSISNIVQNPASGITPSTSVHVSADVTDIDGTISSVVLKWGLAADALSTQITMNQPGKANYSTSTAIPAQADGTTVYYAITATDNLNGETTSAVQNYSVSAPATKLAFVAFPATGQQGVAVGTFTVQAQRDDNTVDVNYTGAITLTKASGSGAVAGTLVKNAVAGVATFNDISFDQTGSYTLNADAAGLTQAVSQQIVITDAPVMTEVLIPRYIQGINGTNNSRLPFAYRATLSNLTPNATYRYMNQIVISTDLPTANGAANVIYVNGDNTFTRTSSPSLSTAGGYGQFTTDANGSFTGWFMNEATGNARFTPGNDVYMRVNLNDGNGGTVVVTRLTGTSPVKVINFGNTADATLGTAIRAESNATAKNFMFLFDNIQGIGRPLYGTSIEATGIDFSSTSWAGFYRDNVAGDNGSWGGIVPNVNANGVKLLQERALANGSIASSFTSADGMWGTYNTVNPTGGTTNVIVIDLTQAPSLNATPQSLTGFNYTEGQGPSTDQSFVISGSNLVSTVVVLAPADYEVSLTGGAGFSGQQQLNINASGGTLNSTTIYVRLKAGLAAGSYDNQLLYVASSGSESVSVSLSGTVAAGIVEPLNHATAFAATAVDFNKIQVSWTDAIPAAANYLIKGSAVGFDAIAAPADGVAETNSALVRNVAAGVQTYTFDGLNGSSTYYFKVFPYNGSASQVNYKTNGTVPQASATTPAGPVMTEDVLPLTLVGSPNRLPYAFRATLSGLTPNATYKYINQAVDNGDGATTSGAGNAIYVSASGAFTRTTGASFTNAAQHAEFTTDANGSYSGWFMLEPTTNARFTPGNTVYMRIRLNNGAGGTTATMYFTSQAVTVIGFGTEANANQGTAVRATSSFLPGNFAFLYPEGVRTGRPVAGTSVESTGIDFSAVTSYPTYFRSLVAGTDGAWGTIIPNILPSGITFIEERSNATGAVVSTKTSNNGSWGATNTVNPAGGLDNVLVLELDTRPTIAVNPASLSGLDYFIGTGPSAEQSFSVSGINLTAGILVSASASFEISSATGAQFVAQPQITVPQAGGVAGPTTVFVRMKAGLSGGNYNESIQLTSAGAVNKSVAVSGVVSTPATEPANHLTSFEANAGGMTSVQLSWVDAVPAATGYLIKGSTSGFDAINAPVDGAVEAESSLVKYVAAGQQTLAITGLNAETRYYFKAFAYNGAGMAINYKTNGNVPQDDALTQGTPGLTNILLPKYIQGLSGTNNSRVPYAFRLQLKNLSPNTTYRYINQAVNAADGPTASGAGNPIYIQNNEFIRSTNPGFVNAGQYGELTTNADGYFDGWFMFEATGNSRFTPGQEIWMRIRLNDGQGGTTAVHYFTTDAVTVINFAQTADAASGTAIRATSGAAPRNMVFIYDNANGNGRPLYGTSIETTGVDYAGNTSYAGFYRTNVAGVIGSWGGIVPNNNVLGVRRVEERSLANGNIVDTKVSEDGFWGLTNTVNPTGGLDNVLVLDLSAGLATEKIAGQLKYFNPGETVMPTTTQQSVFYVQLMENGVAVRPRQLVKFNQTLGLDAYYEFANVEAGRTYSLKVWEQTQDNQLNNTWTWNNWGGVTALDALILSYMTAENPVVEQLPWIAPTGVPNYSTHFFNAADANNSANLSAVDALVLQYRMINSPGYMPLPGGRHNFQVAGAKVASHSTKKYPQAPETVFTPFGSYAPESHADEVYYEANLPVTTTGLNVFNVYFTATGDLNASYVPTPALQSATGLETSEVFNTNVGHTIRIPLFAQDQLNVAAMSLELNYQSALIEVQSVEADGLTNITENKIFVSWFDQQAKTYAAGEVIAWVNATVKAGLNQAQALIAIGQQTEFADQLAQPIQHVHLKTFAYTTVNESAASEISTVVYPNPFKGNATMEIMLPEAGNSKLVIFNKLGQLVSQQEFTSLSGSITIELSGDAMQQSGMYYYQLIHQTAAKSYQSKGSFVVMQ